MKGTGDEIDLTPEQRRRIDDLFSRLAELDHHAVLQIAPGSDRNVVRRAYFERASEFHPDRFFRKRLGPYKAKVDAISQRITEAYEALSRTAPAAVAQAPAQTPGPERERALAALKQQHEARQAEARRLVADADRAAAHGDVARAAEYYRRAASLAPSNSAIRAAHEAASKAVDAGASEALVRQAEFEEKFGHWAEAARTWRRIVDARPDDPTSRLRLEAALRKAGSSGG